MKRLSSFKTAWALVLVLALTIFIGSASAEPWKFGVMSDTQWKASPDGKNPNNVAVGPIVHLNQEFINHGVKFVIQVGDLTEDGNVLEMDETATFRQALYNAGIGFYPLRGNHETSAAMADEFRRVFPQTQTGVHNQTPADALVTTIFYGSPTDPANPFGLFNTNTTFTVGSNFTSPTGIDPNLAGLSYAFDYNDARLMLLDSFTVPNIVCNLIENQQPWITSTLAGRPANTHAFVFAHKGLMMGNHMDILFTAPGKCNGSSTSGTPAVKLAQQNDFIASLYNNGVRYLINGHDHMHNRNIVTSPDGLSKVGTFTAASNSYKYYIPQMPDGDYKYNNQNGVGPAAGNTYPREMTIAQELFTQGYYIVTVDGPKITVDYYASPNGCNGDCDATNDVIPYTFTKHETFGYSLNGKEVLVAQGGSYALTDDTTKAIANGETGYIGTKAAILSGTNGSTGVDFNNRAFTKTVNTGWAPKNLGTRNRDDDPVSDVLTLWGMADSLATNFTDSSNPNYHYMYVVPNTTLTDTYVLSMTYDHHRLLPIQLGKGLLGLATRDEDGDWINAVDKNFGGIKKFVLGPWKAAYGLGTYGIDLLKHTAWAVINYNADFAVAGFRHF